METMRVKILDLEQLVRAAKRISHAAGYLELGMIPQALAQLEGVKDFGPFDAAADLIRGEAFRSQQRHEDAAKWFRQAAQKFANPLNQLALIALSQCLRAAFQGIPSCPHSSGERGRPNRLRPYPPSQPETR
ncbi:MAG: hypothetical protein NZ602_10290 [Thermoguttaceae bacterium]|nr:hypothetical protein [Thermoguttaceae bacterium]MDW8036642.1 hypothetical protein [Thermoguttaceae bacterium]